MCQRLGEGTTGAGAIGERLGLTSGSVTALIGRLEKAHRHRQAEAIVTRGYRQHERKTSELITQEYSGKRPVAVRSRAGMPLIWSVSTPVWPTRPGRTTVPKSSAN
jgi:hypothetical protein